MQPQPSTSTTEGLNWMTILVIIVVIAAGALRLVGWIRPPADPPLLVQANGLVRIAGLDDDRVSAITQVLPQETFGSGVHVIGLYPDGGPDLPSNSFSIIYQKDRWRTLQVDLLPNTTVVDVLGPFNTYPQENVALPNDRLGHLINIKTLLDCLPAKTKEGIGSCRFTRLLVFEIEPGLIGRLAIDGEKITDGELIEIARSMVKSIDEAVSQ